MVIFGALLALANPTNRGTMMAFVFLSQTGFGWAQYLSIAFIQFGTDQVELGIAGGLAGVARFAGGAVAISVYTTILTNVVNSTAGRLVIPAVVGAGGDQATGTAILQALPLGAEALARVPGATTAMITAAGGAFQQAYVIGLRTTALSSLSFGICGIIACLCCEDIEKKMDEKIEVYLENDVNADKVCTDGRVLGLKIWILTSDLERVPLRSGLWLAIYML